MGKHERADVEQAEKIIVKLINNEVLSESEKKHKFLKLCELFSKKIKEDYREIVNAKHIGMPPITAIRECVLEFKPTIKPKVVIIPEVNPKPKPFLTESLITLKVGLKV